MNKIAQEAIAANFYELGADLALSNFSMEKNAFFGPKINYDTLRRALSGDWKQKAIIGGALGERSLGQLGTLGGAGAGAALTAQLAEQLPHYAELPAALALMTGGGYLGNLAGRHTGKGLGTLAGAVSGLKPIRATTNFLADPFNRVPGIRG